ncbi:MAG: hypothetical protein IIB15_01920, partial [Chloroflexi bacterium]|nr:hypothetical protein [Chloroflexota bacterium]
GRAAQPRGHALLYFRNSANPEELWDTYLVVLPILVDVSKYVPPFLMNQMGEFGPKDLSAFAFPPAPEQIADYTYLEKLATAREDDILLGGSINPSDVASAMMIVNEVVQKYAELCSGVMPTEQSQEAIPIDETEGFGINEVLYGLMSDGDKLSELTKLVGQLRFAVEGGEEALANEAEMDIVTLARLLPESNQISRLIEVTKANSARDAKLADLYLQRCFYLLQEEYVKLGEVETEIRTLEAE